MLWRLNLEKIMNRVSTIVPRKFNLISNYFSYRFMRFKKNAVTTEYPENANVDTTGVWLLLSILYIWLPINNIFPLLQKNLIKLSNIIFNLHFWILIIDSHLEKKTKWVSSFFYAGVSVIPNFMAVEEIEPLHTHFIIRYNIYVDIWFFFFPYYIFMIFIHTKLPI